MKLSLYFRHRVALEIYERLHPIVLQFPTIGVERKPGMGDGEQYSQFFVFGRRSRTSR